MTRWEKIYLGLYKIISKPKSHYVRLCQSGLLCSLCHHYVRLCRNYVNYVNYTNETIMSHYFMTWKWTIIVIISILLCQLCWLISIIVIIAIMSQLCKYFYWKLLLQLFVLTTIMSIILFYFCDVNYGNHVKLCRIMSNYCNYLYSKLLFQFFYYCYYFD